MLRQKKPLFVLTYVIVAALLPLIITDAYTRHLLNLVIIFSILALSLDIIIGQMGQFSFGHQTFFGFGGFVSGILTVKFNLPLWPAFFIGIISSGVFGFIIGAIALKRARGFYLGIITLGLGKIAWMVAMKWSKLTGGVQGLPGIPHISFDIPGLSNLQFKEELANYYFLLAALILVIYIIHVFQNSRLGRAIRGVCENEQLANSIGIDPYKYYVVAFTLSCALAGFSGVLYAHYMVLISPVILSMYYMFWMLVMVLVGGSRTFAGPILGALIFIFLPEWLAAVKEYRMVLVGILVLLSVLFMPAGIIPNCLMIMKRLRSRYFGN